MTNEQIALSDQETKRCNKCEERRPLSEFSVKSGGKDGKRPHCKNCAHDMYKSHAAKTRFSGDYSLSGAKKCRGCKKVKGYSEFNKNITQSDGYRRECKSCQKEANAKYNANSKERGARTVKSKVNKNRKDYMRNAHLKNNYNITDEVYREMLIHQKGVCAICKKAETRRNQHGFAGLSVDHDHVTGKVRGLLCRGCNMGLGHFGDNPQLLQSAILYLQ